MFDLHRSMGEHAQVCPIPTRAWPPWEIFATHCREQRAVWNLQLGDATTAAEMVMASSTSIRSRLARRDSLCLRLQADEMLQMALYAYDQVPCCPNLGFAWVEELRLLTVQGACILVLKSVATLAGSLCASCRNN